MNTERFEGGLIAGLRDCLARGLMNIGELEQGLDKAINQVADVVFEDSADEMSFATDIDGSFHSSFKGYLSSLARGAQVPL